MKAKNIISSSKVLKLFGSLWLLAILVFGFSTPVAAVEFRGGNDVVIRAGEVIEDDLYVAANMFTLNGTIKGDLIVMGTNITIGPEGVVEGDFMGGGQAVNINGMVEDDVRVAGAAIVVDGNALLGDDLISAGYSLESKPGSIIEGSLLFAGGQALIAGDVAEDVTVSSGGLEVDGSVGGDVEANVGSPQDALPFSPFMFIPNMPAVPSVPGGLTIGENAQIIGDLTYTAIEDISLPAAAVSGAVTRQEPEIEAEEVEAPPTTIEVAANWFIRTLRSLLTLLLVGLVLVWLFPGFVQQTTSILRQQPLPSFGWGLVSFLGFFLIVFFLVLALLALTVLLALITLGGLLRTSIAVSTFTISGLVLAFLIATALLSKVLVSYHSGRWILTKINSNWAEAKYWSIIVGVSLFVLLASIPYLGAVINFVVILFGLGALVLLVWHLLRPKPEVAVETMSSDA